MDYYWTDATGYTHNIKDMDTKHLINVAKTIWGWAMKRFMKDEEDRELYESQAPLLPGFDAVERVERSHFDYTADHYEIFEPVVEELRQRHIKVVDENGVLLFDDMKIQND